MRDFDIIKPEFKQQWLACLFSSRNFFKHADRDSEEVHEFKEEFNVGISECRVNRQTSNSSWPVRFDSHALRRDQ